MNREKFYVLPIKNHPGISLSDVELQANSEITRFYVHSRYDNDIYLDWREIVNQFDEDVDQVMLEAERIYRESISWGIAFLNNCRRLDIPELFIPRAIKIGVKDVILNSAAKLPIPPMEPVLSYRQTGMLNDSGTFEPRVVLDYMEREHSGFIRTMDCVDAYGEMSWYTLLDNIHYFAMVGGLKQRIMLIFNPCMLSSILDILLTSDKLPIRNHIGLAANTYLDILLTQTAIMAPDYNDHESLAQTWSAVSAVIENWPECDMYLPEMKDLCTDMIKAIQV